MGWAALVYLTIGLLAGELAGLSARRTGKRQTWIGYALLIFTWPYFMWVAIHQLRKGEDID